MGVVSRAECEARMKLAQEATMMPQTQVQLWHFRNDALQLAEWCLALLDENANLQERLKFDKQKFDQRDKERLDWLELQQGNVRDAYTNNPKVGVNIREAIDTAMSGNPAGASECL